MKIRNNLIGCLAISAAFSLATPVFAQEGTTKDGQPATGTGASKANAKSSMTSSSSDKAGSKKAGANGAQLSSQDREFIMEAAKGGMMEVEMGKMAQQKGQSGEVKKIGSMMVSDHTKANNQLMSLAQKKGVTLDKKAKAEKMSAGGAEFDSMYLSQMVKDHEKDIAAFEKESKNGTDPDVKSWATKTLPTLKKHLQAVQTAQSKVSSGGSEMKKKS